LPVVSVLTQALPIAEAWAGVGFHNAAGDVRFTTYLRPVPR
jgi:hypothetical protein